MNDDDDTPPSPGQDGSPEALQVLLAMSDWKHPIGQPQLSALTRLPDADLVLALQGLQQRGRIHAYSDAAGTLYCLANRMPVTL